jgi:N-dimethylarginine dimethylaminohydrolase
MTTQKIAGFKRLLKKNFNSFIITKKISSSLEKAISLNPQPINIEKAKIEHENYENLLKSIIGKDRLVSMDESPEFPDSCFIEDPIIFIEDTIVVNNMGHPSRKGEVTSIIELLHNFPNKNTNVSRVIKMDFQNTATIDGGDILHVPNTNEIFVGLSKRTNLEGASILKSLFPNMNIILVEVLTGLHLKSFISFLGCANDEGKTIIAASSCVTGRNIMNQINSSVNGKNYIPMFVPDVEMSNCITVPVNPKNKKKKEEYVVIVKDGFQKSFDIYNDAISKFNGKIRLEKIQYNELYKIDGCLTCCCVIFF